MRYAAVILKVYFSNSLNRIVPEAVRLRKLLPMIAIYPKKKGTSVQVMTWCCQTTNYFLSRCWLRSLSPYGITKPQWVHHHIIIPCHIVSLSQDQCLIARMWKYELDYLLTFKKLYMQWTTIFYWKNLWVCGIRGMAYNWFFGLSERRNFIKFNPTILISMFMFNEVIHRALTYVIYCLVIYKWPFPCTT